MCYLPGDALLAGKQKLKRCPELGPPYLQLLRVESELWTSDLQKSVGNANFLARSAVPFDDTEMKQMYIVQFCELVFSGDGQMCTSADSITRALFDFFFPA